MAYSKEFQNRVLSYFEEKSNQLDRIQAMLDKNIEPTVKLQTHVNAHKYVWVYVGLLLAGAMVTAALVL